MKHYLRVIILFLSCVAIHVNCFSQEPPYAWARGIGGKQNDDAEKILVDARGNVYTSGYYSDTVDFDPGTGSFIMTPARAGALESYLLKLDALGRFVWAKRIVSTSSSILASIQNMCFDNAGNLCLTGNFADTTDFDIGPATHNEISKGGSDAYVMKVDTSGNFLWVKTFGGAGNDVCTSIATDVAGNIFLGGRFSDTADFDPGSGVYNLTATTGEFGFICKLNSLGNFAWAKKIPADVLSIAADPLGNVISTGLFNDTHDFDPGPGFYNLTVINGPPFFSGPNNFLLKLDASGNFVWANRISAAFEDRTNNIVQSDAASNIYLTTTFWESCDFDPGIGTYNLTTSMADVALMKLNASGQFMWAKQLGFAGGANRPFSMTLDNAGKIYVTGLSNGAMFLSKLDTAGIFAWTSIMGSIGAAMSIAVDAGLNIYTTGSFSSTVDFDMSAAVHNLIAVGNSLDVFIYKLGNNSLPLTLLSFTAKKQDKTNLLQWTTTQEINVYRFEVERSFDGREFAKIGTVKAGQTKYSFSDEKPETRNINYYRLKMIDKDGQFTYSPIRQITTNNSPLTISIYPNPAKDKLQLQIDSERKLALKMDIITQDGKVVLSSNISATEGSILRSLNISRLQSGPYFLRITSGENEQSVMKFEKVQ